MVHYVLNSANEKVFVYSKSEENPSIYIGKITEHYGVNKKSSLYQASPENAKNIRMRKGNGIIDADTYKFAYADRYLGADEEIAVEYTFELND